MADADAILSPKGGSSRRYAYPRQRAITACQLCRARRTKCDRKRPLCSTCQKYGAICTIAEDEANLLDPGSVQILQRIDNLEEIIKTQLTSKTVTTNAMPKTERKRRLRVTTEEILSWGSFGGRYDLRRDLKALLRAQHRAVYTSPSISIDSSFVPRHTEDTYPQRLLENFFAFVHIQNPMLDEAKMKPLVHQLSVESPPWTTDACLALIVCALGCLAPSRSKDSLSSEPMSIAVAESYFNAGRVRLGTIIGRGGVVEAQCFFYAGVFLMSKLKPLEAWRSFNQALGCCQDFACADPAYSDHVEHFSSGTQRCSAEECVYWSCWKSELELRKLLKLPDFAFDDLSYPLLYPTPPDSVRDQQTTSWFFHLSEISLRRLDLRVRSEISKALETSEPSLLIALEHTTQAAESLAEEWEQSLHASMSLKTRQCDDDVLKFILRGHLLDLWEVVYWPWLDVLINRNLQSSMSQQYVSKVLQVAVDRIRTNKPGFRLRHHGTWLMLQSCTRSALLLLAVACCAESAVLLPHRWKDTVFDVIELLRYWQYDAGDATDRLQILEELCEVVH